jgi:hypothetical protein
MRNSQNFAFTKLVARFMLQVGLKFFGDNNVFKARKSLDSGTAMI